MTYCIISCISNQITIIRPPLSLHEAITLALQDSPFLNAHSAEVRGAVEGEKASKGQLLPRLDAYAGYQRTSDPVVVVPIKGFNTTAVEKALPAIAKQFPAIDFQLADTQKNIITTSISNMTDALRDAIIMTIAVIFLILANLRLSLLAAISIPFTYCLTFAAMYVLGYELNIVTLTAIIVAVGLLLDDAIVVIDNIERHYHTLQEPIKEAVLNGLKEIMLADWAGTYTTVIVLLPIMFIGGYVQKILRPFTVVLSLSLLASYIVSVTVIPILAPYIIQSTSHRFGSCVYPSRPAANVGEDSLEAVL